MAGLENVKVGDRLTVIPGGYYRQCYTFPTVERVTKTCVYDSDGARWTMRGRRWGSSDMWGGAWCRPFEQEDEETNRQMAAEVKIDRMRNRIRGTPWRDVPADVIEAVCAVLDSHGIKEG